MNKKFMRTGAVLLCVLCFAFSAAAQKKKTTTKSTTTIATPVANAAEVRAGAEKVSIQIKNVSKFIYLLGTIAQGIEDLDKDPKATQNAVDKNRQNKQAVITTIKNLRFGLAALEVEFRTKPALRTYLLQVDGIAALCGQTEDLAVAGKFLDSGRPLLSVIEKLSDALVSMP